MISFVLPLASALVLALGIAPLIIWIYKRLALLDDPSVQSHPKVIHTRPLPRGGGIVIAFGCCVTIFLFVPLSIEILGVLAGAFVLSILGIWDDIADPHPLVRLFLQCFAALLPILTGIAIPFITNPFGGVVIFEQTELTLGSLSITLGFLAPLLAVIWIVWCMNIVNFSTGLDGQMPGYVAIAAVTIAALSTRFFPDREQYTVFTLAMIVAGSYLGFLFWNMYPQKMMAGFGASTLAGYFLAVLSILSGAKLATAILVLAIPMADALFVISRRLLSGKSPFLGDRTHLHHALLDRGLSKRQVAYAYWITAAILGFLALQLTSGQKVFTILLAIALVCIIGTWLRFFTTQFGKSGRDSG